MTDQAYPLSALMTRKQVAEILSVGVPAVARFTKRGRLPAVVISKRCVRYKPSVVAEFIAKGSANVNDKAAIND